MHHRVLLALAMALNLPAAATAQECAPSSHDALIMLDASFSMLTVLSSGQTRFAAARDAVDAAVDLFPPDGWLALRLFGSQSQVVRRDCVDTVLAVPFAPANQNRQTIKLMLAQSHPHGVTPIAYSLEQAMGDFPSDAVDHVIILVTDGGESCNGDTCGTAADLRKKGFVVNVVGLMPSAATRRGLQCIATTTGGTYFNVPVAAQLPDKLRRAAGECPVAELPSFIAGEDSAQA